VAHGDQPGLRKRLAHEARRIATQHDALNGLESTTRRALEQGDPRAMADALRDFQAALDAHFSLEEQVHFPAVHGLDGSRSREIAALVREHRGFRQSLASLRTVVPAAAVDGARAAVLADFARLAAALRRHEEREEALFAALPR
jgi:iron-sulfur cluster repair protein YtfE (RIC family)